MGEYAVLFKGAHNLSAIELNIIKLTNFEHIPSFLENVSIDIATFASVIPSLMAVLFFHSTEESTGGNLTLKPLMKWKNNEERLAYNTGMI